MSIYSWSLPSPPGSPLIASGVASATLRTALGGLLDMMIDPVSLDYIDTADGEWLETADSRTLMMIMIEMELGEDPFAPQDGTRIKARLASGDPVTPDMVVDEVLRVGQLLVDDGTITDLSVSTDVDEGGRFVVVLRWRDLATSSPVDLVYTPFQG